MAVDIGEPIVAALEFIGQLLVIDAKKMKHGGLEVMDVDFVFHGVETDVVAFSVSDAWLHPASGHPDGEGVGMVIATPFRAVVDIALDERSAAKLSAPDDEGVIEEAALFEILHEGGGRLVGVAALIIELGGEGSMLIPPCVHELDKTGSSFDEATGEEAIPGEAAGFVDLWAVEIEDGFGLAGDVRQLRDGSLHAIGHLVLCDAGLNLGVADLRVFFLIQGGDAIEHVSSLGGVDALWIF